MRCCTSYGISDSVVITASVKVWGGSTFEVCECVRSSILLQSSYSEFLLFLEDFPLILLKWEKGCYDDELMLHEVCCNKRVQVLCLMDFFFILRINMKFPVFVCILFCHGENYQMWLIQCHLENDIFLYIILLFAVSNIFHLISQLKY